MGNQNQHKIKSFIHYTPTEGSTYPKDINHYHIIVISIPGHCAIYDDKLKSCIAVKTHIFTPNNQNQHKIKSFMHYTPTEGSTHPKDINHYHIIVISIPGHCTIYDDKLKSCIAVKTDIFTPNNQNQHKIKSFIHYTPTEGLTHPKDINHYHIIVISIPGHCAIYDDKLKSCI